MPIRPAPVAPGEIDAQCIARQKHARGLHVHGHDAPSSPDCNEDEQRREDDPDGGAETQDTEPAMKSQVPAPNECRLSDEDAKPGEPEQAMHDEFRIAVAGLPDIGKQIVRKPDHAERDEQCADDHEIVLDHYEILSAIRKARIPATMRIAPPAAQIVISGTAQSTNRPS